MPEGAQDNSFEEFWRNVPHKIGKAASEKAWRKLGSADKAEALRLVGAFYSWFAKTYPTASPLHPSTYLNGKRWQDEGVSSRSDVSTDDVRRLLETSLKSTVPAVREHAMRMAEKHGIRL